MDKKIFYELMIDRKEIFVFSFLQQIATGESVNTEDLSTH